MTERREPGRRESNKKLWLILLCVILIAAAVLFIFKAVVFKEEAPAEETLNDEVSTSSGTVTWQGKEYVYNDHLSNYLLLGIDTREKAETSSGQADAGQADALYLLSWDRVEKTITMITIPRDTMTEIEVFGPSGESFGKSKDHVSISYAYGDGGHESLPAHRRCCIGSLLRTSDPGILCREYGWNYRTDTKHRHSDSNRAQ